MTSPDDTQPAEAQPDPLAATNCGACGHPEHRHGADDDRGRHWCRGCDCPGYEPPPTTQRSPLPAAEQARVAAMLVHDAAVAVGLQAQLDELAAQVCNDLATAQLCAEAMIQNHGGDAPYRECAAAIQRVAKHMDTLRGAR
jgi:hypothetical protein